MSIYFEGMMGITINYLKVEHVQSVDDEGNKYTTEYRSNDRIGIDKNAFITWAHLLAVPDMGWDELLKRVDSFVHFESPERAAKIMDSVIWTLLQYDLISPAQVVANELAKGPRVQRYLTDLDARTDKVAAQRKQYDREIAAIQALKRSAEESLKINADDKLESKKSQKR